MIVNKLPQLLIERGLSIRELARRTGITYTTIWAVVHGQRRSIQLDVLDAICQVLQTQPGDIFSVLSEQEASVERQDSGVQPGSEEEARKQPVIPVAEEQILPEPTRRPRRADIEWRSW